MQLPFHAPSDAPAIATGLDLPELRTSIPGPGSLELAARLSRVESPDTTFLSAEFPVFWHSALGSNVIDVDGNRFLDFDAGFGAAAVGYSHPRVVEAVESQARRLIHAMGDVHPPEIKVRLAEEIQRRAPAGEDWRLIFGLNGSDSVEAALKTAAIATGKPGTISFQGAYHGVSIGALAATRAPKFTQGLNDLISPHATLFPYPSATDSRLGHTNQSAERVLDDIDGFLRSRSGIASRVGGLIVEPIQGRGGVVIPPDRFLPGLREICDEHGILLIIDEVFTGFGRTGDWFDSTRQLVIPDLLIAGKALGGGMPISVCIGRAEIIEKWGRSTGEARHTYTFLGHPVSCAAALAALDVIDSEQLLARSKAKGADMLRQLQQALLGNSRVVSIRGRGLLIGIEIIDPETGQPDGPSARKAMLEGLRRGIILLTSGQEGNVISLSPPLVITDAQIDHGVREIATILTEM